jgi:hypothetical protein
MVIGQYGDHSWMHHSWLHFRIGAREVDKTNIERQKPLALNSIRVARHLCQLTCSCFIQRCIMALLLNRSAAFITRVDARSLTLPSSPSSSVRALLPQRKVPRKAQAPRGLTESSCVLGAVHGSVNRRAALTSCKATNQDDVVHASTLEGALAKHRWYHLCGRPY